MKTCRRGLHQFEGKQCIECRRAGHRAWLKANPGQVKATRARWRAVNAARIAERDGARVKAWVAANPERRVAYSRAWYEANGAAERAKRKAWRLANPEKVTAHATYSGRARRARKASVRVSKVRGEQLRNLFARQEGKCRYCRCDISKHKHLDHVVPLARGGAHAIENLCYACPLCNRRKNALPAEEFMRRYGLAS